MGLSGYRTDSFVFQFGRRQWARFKNWPQGANEFVDLLFGNHEWRQHSQNGFMSAIQDESLMQELSDDVFAWNSQLDGEHQAFSAHIGNHGYVLEFFETSLEIGTDDPDPLQEVFLFEDFEIFKTGAASQRTSAEGCAMLAGFNGRGNFLLQKDRAQGNTEPERFRAGNHVGEKFLVIW